MKAHRRPVSGCGSQRMLHALERRSHPADHGSSFASLYSPFCRYATSSPDRGKSLLAGGGQLSCNSRTGQIKNPPSECSGSNHIRHSYRMGLATTTTAASGRCREELLGQRPARRKCRPRHDADAGGRNPISGGHFKWLCSGNSKIKFHCFCFSLSFASRAARSMASTSTSSTAPMPHAEAKSPSSKARRYSSTESVAPLEV